MRTTRMWILAGCCTLATALLLTAQTKQRPGLYETTSSMTWQQSPMPNGMQMPPGAPHTFQMCVTQEMIDKYGGFTPQANPQSQCQTTHVNKTATGMTADWVCTGDMKGTGAVSSTWSPDGKSTSKVHFKGVMQMGQRSAPVEWTIESSSVYKGPDCGSVKPIQTPAQ